MRILMITAPMTQLNTPYPAVPHLVGVLKAQGYPVGQADFSLELALRVFSGRGVAEMADVIEKEGPVVENPTLAKFLVQKEQYRATVDAVVRYLQGRDPALAYRILEKGFLPEGRRLAAVNPETLQWGFGSQSLQDLAKHLASLYIDELADVIREGVDSRFGLAKYAEKLAASAPQFAQLDAALARSGTLLDRLLEEITEQTIKAQKPQVVCLSVPFTGTVYGAFRVAQAIKAKWPKVTTILGGGYVNTELRTLKDPRIFDFFDFVTLDDGEAPLVHILKHLATNQRRPDKLIRTFVRENGAVRLINEGRSPEDFAQKDLAPPTYEGLTLGRYLSLVEMLNPMHRLWSDGHWNKLMIAHGCYWKKCAFCDTSLDYIARYDYPGATKIVDRMEALLRETGQSGFHFVDEAAPPKALKELAEEILKRGLTVSWWGNVRFEKTFTPALVELLARSGCIAVSGGLEVASDRLLKLMNKGVSVEQVARVTRNFAERGILVHAYLIYGFPSETVGETVETLERVRQLFKAECLQSAFWHRFSATAHSPIGQAPQKYGLQIVAPQGGVAFAHNDLVFRDHKGCSEEELTLLGKGLETATYNYMHGAGLELDVREWFEMRVKKPKIARNEIERFILS